MATGHNEPNPPLAHLHVDPVVQQPARHIADHRRQEDQRDDGVVDPVVLLKVGDERSIRGVIGAENDERVEGCEDAEEVATRVVPFLKDGYRGGRAG